MRPEANLQPAEQKSSWIHGDKVWDKMFELAGVNMDAFNDYCLSHPKLMRALADGNSYARPVLGAVALGAFARAVNTENRKLSAISLGLFTVACLTDSWDGYWSRKGNV